VPYSPRSAAGAHASRLSLLAILVATALATGGLPRVATPANPASAFYVDPAATGSGNGTSWANAWRDFGSVRWSSIGPGDTLYIGGGTYDAPSFVVGASGVGGAPISIRPGRNPGHNGAVIFNYASLGSSATATGISLGTQHDVTIAGDGRWQFVNLVNSTSGTSSAGISGQDGNRGSRSWA
jgi:hypothetical protein